MAIIILEGCDCSGKSTLAEALAKITGYEIVKGSSFEISQLGKQGMFDYMMSLLEKDNIIIDRFYMSNYVYGNLYDYPTMDEEHFMDLSTEVSRKAFTVYVKASEECIVERMEYRGDDDIKLEEVGSILRKYDEAFSDFATSTNLSLQVDTELNTNTVSTASLIAEIVQLDEFFIYLKNS